MKKITKRQSELIKFCGYEIKDNRLIGEEESLSSIFFDKETGLFSIDIKSHTFSLGDYDSVEYFTIALNRMLGLVYELNSLVVLPICPICNQKYSEPPAISRKDNKTKICSNCGIKEATNDFINHMKKEVNH